MGLGLGFLAFALLYSSAHKSKTGRKVLLGLVALLVLFVAFGLMFRDSDLVKNSGYLTRLTDFSLKTYTVQTRFWAWEAGFKGWKESFKTILLGWGPENFNIPFSKHFNPNFFRGIGSETLFDRAHNQFIEVLVTMGLIGFTTYLSIYYFAFRNLWSNLNNVKYKHYAIGLIPLLIAYIIHNSFIFDTSSNFYVFFLIVGFIFYLSQENNGSSQTKPHQGRLSGGVWISGALIMAVVTGVFIYYFNILPSKANYATTRAITRSWGGDFNGAVEKFKEAVGYNVPGKYEYRNRFAQFVLEYANSRPVTPEIESALRAAALEVQKNIDENEPDYLPYLYMSRLHISLGKGNPASPDNDRALEYSLKALDLSKTFVRTYYEIGQVYLNKEEIDKAAEYFRKAAELNPDVGLSQWYLGIVEVERGRVSEGLRIIEDAIASGRYSPTESDLNRMINIYLEQKNIAGVKWALESLVQSKPANPQYHASLATLYSQIGRIDDAVKEAKIAADLDQSFEAEARAFVQSLGRTW
jgi:tetratricopeptide (TPR) repeat protein